MHAYNHEHHHTGIGLHTPADVHYGHAKAPSPSNAPQALAEARAVAPQNGSARGTDPKILALPDDGLDQPPSPEPAEQASRLTPTGLIHLDKFRSSGERATRPL